MNFSVIGRNPMTILQNQGQDRNRNYFGLKSTAKNRADKFE
jgi:hypothetical protein